MYGLSFEVFPLHGLGTCGLSAFTVLFTTGVLLLTSVEFIVSGFLLLTSWETGFWLDTSLLDETACPDRLTPSNLSLDTMPPSLISVVFRIAPLLFSITSPAAAFDAGLAAAISAAKDFGVEALASFLTGYSSFLDFETGFNGMFSWRWGRCCCVLTCCSG